MSEDDKYFLLYKDNFLQPIQILLSLKEKTFSEFFSAFLKSTLHFEHFQKKMTLIGNVFPKLPSPKNVIRQMSVKSRFSGLLRNKTWQKGPKTVEIYTTLPLPYFFIPVNIIQVEKIYASALQNLRTVC